MEILNKTIEEKNEKHKDKKFERIAEKVRAKKAARVKESARKKGIAMGKVDYYPKESDNKQSGKGNTTMETLVQFENSLMLREKKLQEAETTRLATTFVFGDASIHDESLKKKLEEKEVEVTKLK